MRFVIPAAALLLTLFAPVNSRAQDVRPTEEGAQGHFEKQDHYSPYAGRNFPTEVFWGDTHLHTGMSMDAGAFGARLSPEDAYRFARGEEITSSTGQRVKLSRPLDFLVVADHSDNMGFFPRLVSGEPSMLADPTGRRWYDGIQEGGQTAVGVAVEVIQSLTNNNMPEALASLPGSDAYRDAWNVTLSAAETYNDPGEFTAFIGYEWTSTDKGLNLHRVVVYRDDASKAGMMEPYTTLPPYGSPHARDLWNWMQSYEDSTGGRMLAIAHNGNMSNGWMFPQVELAHGAGTVDQQYVETRARWEPLYEVTQIKGDGETHPVLSPNDEFADYGTWDVGNLDITEIKTDDMLQREYAREALKNGFVLEKKLGTNPYKFGLIGATDSHTGLSTAEEENFFGKSTSVEPSKDRVSHPFVKSKLGEISGDMLVASGYQGVWATENTREAIFDAMMRKETYATTGPRMLVRFFGGWDYDDDDLRSRVPAFLGYEKGVPMGGDLKQAPRGKKAPTFMVLALRDPVGANLDRVQIVKGWMDKNGKTHEKVHDVIWSGDRKPDSKGKLPPVGNTVDLEAANWTNTIGASELTAVWTDPDFDSKENAFYYARVIEIPTPRWIVYDKVRLGAELPKDAELIHQERAYTSPIWYNPPKG